MFGVEFAQLRGALVKEFRELRSSEPESLEYTGPEAYSLERLDYERASLERLFLTLTGRAREID